MSYNSPSNISSSPSPSLLHPNPYATTYGNFYNAQYQQQHSPNQRRTFPINTPAPVTITTPTTIMATTTSNQPFLDQQKSLNPSRGSLQTPAFALFRQPGAQKGTFPAVTSISQFIPASEVKLSANNNNDGGSGVSMPTTMMSVTTTTMPVTTTTMPVMATTMPVMTTIMPVATTTMPVTGIMPIPSQETNSSMEFANNFSLASPKFALVDPKQANLASVSTNPLGDIPQIQGMTNLNDPNNSLIGRDNIKKATPTSSTSTSIVYPTNFQTYKDYMAYLEQRILEIEAKFGEKSPFGQFIQRSKVIIGQEQQQSISNLVLAYDLGPSNSKNMNQNGMKGGNNTIPISLLVATTAKTTAAGNEAIMYNNKVNQVGKNGLNEVNGNVPSNKSRNTYLGMSGVESSLPNKNIGEQNNLKLEARTIVSDYGAVKAAKEFVDDINSDYYQLLKRLRLLTTNFIDPDFPPESKSLIGSKDPSDLTWDIKDLIWCRPDDFYGHGNYNIYQKGISIDDIKQGQLGDCYYLSTLAALAEFPSRIERLLVSKEINQQGCYAIRICDMGIWQEVIVDDYFPCYKDDHTLAFAKGNGNELWVLLLEKAWAKIYGSYAKIEAGLTREALHDLTGAPTVYYNISEMKDNPDKKEKLWGDILHGEKHDYVMTCGSYGDNDNDERNGIYYGHAYSLISAYEINTPKHGKMRFLKIRNPHSHGEWTGDWSDHSPLWTPEIKALLGYVDADDGTFFMSWNDFFEYYEDVEICKVHDDYHYSYLKVKSSTHKNATFFSITITKPGKYYITINQQSKRHHIDQENFQHSPIWMFIGKVVSNDDNRYEFMNGVYRADREVFIEEELITGEYHVYVKASWFDKISRDFVISVYGPDDVEIRKIAKKDCFDYINRIFLHRARQCKKIKNYSKHGHPNCIKAMDLTDEGYFYIYYKNRSAKTLIEVVEFAVLEGRKLIKPYRGKRFEVRVKPNEEKIVLLKEDYWAENVKHNMTINTQFE